ncbi:MAG: HipA family kinase [Cyanobacteria bacterium P01_H01_bin.105]
MMAELNTVIPTYSARRVVSAERSGSSCPVVVATDAGYFFTKLRGAAQGPSALVAEIIVAGLAEALGLWVPSRVLIAIEPDLKSDVQEDEFMDLLTASHGINLGFQYLQEGHDIGINEIATIHEEVACAVLWLDLLVMNVDRTVHNLNMMRSHHILWVIDHGAALPFQYNWPSVREDSPRHTPDAMEHHIFWNRLKNLDRWDEQLAAKLSRSVLQSVVSQVPDCFLQPLMSPPVSAAMIERRRQAYAAFLWKRLKSPRPFMAR